MMDRAYLAAGMPVQLVWGRDDTVILVAHEALPGSRLAVLDGAGHHPHRDRSEEFVAVVRSFLAETTPASFDREAWRELLLAGQPRPDRQPRPLTPAEAR